MKRLASILMRALVPARREPDFIIGGASDPYLRRWWLIPRNRFFNVYLHEFKRSDDDRALHDHPWPSLSLALAGCLIEHTAAGAREILAGDVRLRSARLAHRLELIGDSAWTLFITGPRIREWGFHCPRGWVHWQDFTTPNDIGSIGRGCE